jgi:hypothetical protein
MKKYSVYAVMAMFIFFCWVSGCSKSDTGEKGFVEKTNEEMSKSAIDYVNKPLSKARQVENMAKQREKGREEAQETAGE